MAKTPEHETKLPLTSADLTEDFLAQLRATSPQIFSEGKVDFAKLQAALGEHVADNPERYSLTWAGKREAFRNVQMQSVATLRPQVDASVNWDSTENLILEGDNLEVLKLLQKPYHNKVKMIYIDPPYNTGNEFIYPDNFREGLDEYLRYTGQRGEDGAATSTNKDTSGRYHSNWLNMMYPRLFLARNLLKEDGVIFVSIDDHEVHNLRLLMDEVFGEENFVATLIWKSRQIVDSRPQSGSSKDHEYLLCYSRSTDAQFRGTAIDLKKYTNPDNDNRGAWMSNSILGLANKEQRPNLHYAITDPDTGLNYECPSDTGWRYSKETMNQKISELRIVFPKKQDGRPREKKFLAELQKEFTGFSTILDATVGFTLHGTREVRDILGEAIFSFPKPASLIKTIIQQTAQNDDIILDFFAGSGTTAHAVLDLNQQDSGRRKFILVQLPEKTDNPQYPTIAHITRERVRRVIAKQNQIPPSPPFSKGENVAAGELFADPLTSESNPPFAKGGRGDLGFRAFKLDSSNFKIWRSDQAPLSAEQLAEQLLLYTDNVLAERSVQDRLYELILKSGWPLSVKVESIKVGQHPAYSIGGGAGTMPDGQSHDGDGQPQGQASPLLICLEAHLTRETLRALFALQPQKLLCLDAAFDGNDALKTNTLLEAETHGIIFKTV